MILDDTKIIEDCREFLGKSSRRYNKSISRMVKDLKRYSGTFWDTDMINDYRPGKNRLNLSMNNWSVMSNAIASPLSASPWHTELKNKTDEVVKGIQEAIDSFEQRNDAKSAYLDAFRKDVLTGSGYCVVSTDIDTVTGQPTITLESVKYLQSVALDPGINTVDGSDAEQGALVNFMPVRKARRLYGDDVVPMDYPESQGLLNLKGMDQWNVPEGQVPVVSYYVKENDGVHFYKICSEKVVQSEVLPISFIPIVRFAGNEIYTEDRIDYNGIIQQTFPLELGCNIAYSTLIERCGRSAKANYLINVDAIDGLQEYYAKCDRDDAMVVMWKGEHQPVPLTESFETGDLQTTVTTCRTLMEDVIGVPLTGIPQGQPEKTATEILRQQVSKESNTASYFNNAYTATRTISMIIIQLLNNGQLLDFSLENGPNVITRQMKARQELSALATIAPDTMKPIIAKYFADTLEDDVGEFLSKNIVANLPRDIVYIDNGDVDPNAVHQLESMKATLDMAMMQLDQQMQLNGQLQKQLDAAQMSLMENREQRMLDWSKFQVSEQDKMALETAKLQMQGEVDAAKMVNDSAKLQVEAMKAQAKAENDTDKVMLEVAKQNGEVEEAYNQGEDSGYEQGVSDGVDAAYGG